MKTPMKSATLKWICGVVAVWVIAFFIGNFDAAWHKPPEIIIHYIGAFILVLAVVVLPILGVRSFLKRIGGIKILDVAKTKAALKNKIIACAAILFLASCLVPPWEYLDDRSSIRLEGITIPGAHGRQPASYSFLFIPPRISGHNGVQIDFGRLFLEWGALAAVTGLAWMFVGKSD